MSRRDPTSNEPQSKGAASLRGAFNRATGWFGNLLAPLVIVTYASDVERAFLYVLERPVFTGTVGLIFIMVFAYNVIRNIDVPLSGWIRKRNWSIQGKAGTGLEHNSSEVKATEDGKQDTRSRTLVWWATTIGSLVALVLVAYVYTMVFVSGLHFVVVASAPTQESAVREIQSLNTYFRENEYADLEARAYASSATGSSWYMISIGGWHTSRNGAEDTFRRTKEALGSNLRSDAYIYSTENASPFRVIRNRMRQFIQWIRSFF